MGAKSSKADPAPEPEEPPTKKQKTETPMSPTTPKPKPKKLKTFLELGNVGTKLKEFDQARKFYLKASIIKTVLQDQARVVEIKERLAQVYGFAKLAKEGELLIAEAKALKEALWELKAKERA